MPIRKKSASSSKRRHVDLRVHTLHEVYVRDDISCSSRLCDKCKDDSPILSQTGPYIIPETTVLLENATLLENPLLKNVIFLNTFVDDARKRSPSAYGLVKRCVEARDRAILFPNQNHPATRVEGYRGRTEDQAQLLMNVAGFYSRHLPSPPQIVVLLADSAHETFLPSELGKLAARAALGNVRVGAVSDVIPELFPDIPRHAFAAAAAGAEYPPHISIEEADARIKAGTLLAGKFSAARENPFFGSVSCRAKDLRVLVRGRRNVNRALNGDRVAVLVHDAPERDEGDKAGEGGEGGASAPQATGEIVAILERSVRALCGSVIPLSPPGASSFRGVFAPVRPNFPRVRLLARGLRDLLEKRVAVTITDWPADSVYPVGALAEVIGRTGDPDTEVEVILRENTVRNFSLETKELVGCLPRMPWAPNEGEIFSRLDAAAPDAREEAEPRLWEGILAETLVRKHIKRTGNKQLLLGLPPFRSTLGHAPSRARFREDLRHVIVCSVDPPGCKDIDDALSCREMPLSPTRLRRQVDRHIAAIQKRHPKIRISAPELPPLAGMLEVGVHIADVSNFVRPDSAIDAEARKRGTTVYLVDRRIDMLPRLLTEDLCSLRSGVSRCTFSAIFLVDPRTGRVVADRFTKAIVHSTAALSYEEAQGIIDGRKIAPRARAMVEDTVRGLAAGGNMDDDVKTRIILLQQALRALMTLANKMQGLRDERGCLVLDSPAVKFKLDERDRRPTEVTEYPAFETNNLVQQMMLLANERVARAITAVFPTLAVLRRHPEPPRASFDELNEQVRKLTGGFALDPTTNKSLAASLRELYRIYAGQPGGGRVPKLVSSLMTRSLSLAKYFCAGSFAPAEYVHYGLASKIYTHFTSPIRRYADLLVHRLLGAALGLWPNEGVLASMERVEETMDRINALKEAADQAGRDATQIWGVLLLQKAMEAGGAAARIEAEAEITRFLKDRTGVIVLVRKFGISGPVFFSRRRAVADTRFDEAEDSLAWTSADGAERKVRVFDKVTVAVEFDVAKRHEFRLCFSLVSPPPPRAGGVRRELTDEQVALVGDAEILEEDMVPVEGLAVSAPEACTGFE
eukprot:gnl/Chilomastix_cuspidata/316.p1 GENE.gnl/Chilomastix_cuspidata/316~~gnl/Chilomastix_cuspidata/316.p1  ORF type:complete len:1087 (+),score=498.71 gnl/Chilomastix_cuspidata/316:1497-4757(+)